MHLSWQNGKRTPKSIRRAESRRSQKEKEEKAIDGPAEREKIDVLFWVE